MNLYKLSIAADIGDDQVTIFQGEVPVRYDAYLSKPNQTRNLFNIIDIKTGRMELVLKCGLTKILKPTIATKCYHIFIRRHLLCKFNRSNNI